MKNRRLDDLKSLMKDLLSIDGILTLQNSILAIGKPDENDLKEAARLIPQLEPFEIAYGAQNTYVFPFLCKQENASDGTTAQDVLNFLKVKSFKSEHITHLDQEFLEFPGYHPSTLNDEIHNDFSEQNIFDAQDENQRPVPPEEGIHGSLMKNVLDQKLWHILLHPWEKATASDIQAYNKREGLEYTIILGNDQLGYFKRTYGNVLLLTVGFTQDKKCMIGYISHQLCHNLCD